jgi:rSAM/selenodomain-associated transferase 1
MVADVISHINASGLPLYLFHDGADAAGLPSEWVAASDHVVSQTGETLGDRMTTAFQHLFSEGIERVILVGSDIPGISAAILKSAVASLDKNDLVIVPAVDGGYCLIASSRERFDPVIFRDIPWSTSQVLSRTLEVCSADRINVELFRPLQDIDTLEDLTGYCRKPFPYATATTIWLAGNGFPVSQA